MQASNYFPTTIWFDYKPEFLESLNKASDKYINHDHLRHRTVICITSKALVRVCYSRNDPAHLPTFGIVAGKPRMSMAQYAPGRTPPRAGWIDGMAKGDHKCDPTTLSQEGSVVRVWGG